MMACHRTRPDAWPGDGLWYDGLLDEDSVQRSWDFVAEKLCKQWNVFAVDLQNEPHASSWGKGNPATDWDQGAQRMGDYVLQKCSRWLIMVEGVGFTPGAKGGDGPGMGIWWGENLHSLNISYVGIILFQRVISVRQYFFLVKYFCSFGSF